jgi:hypothetical protein
MDRVFGMLLVLPLLPAPLAAQRPENDHRTMYSYGYNYSPWSPSPWDALDYRTKCEGEQVRGMETGPVKWEVEFRNRTTDLVSFDYVILPPGTNKPLGAKGRGRTKPGKTMSRLAVLATTRCDDGITIHLESVRIGADVDSVPYRKPDRAS